MMKKFNNVKTIAFKASYEGQGCVNFDSKEQSYYLSKNGLCVSVNDNVCYAKKQFSKNNGVTTFKYKVSSECLRHEIFKDAIPYQNPNLVAVPYILYNALSLPDMIMRGYCFTQRNKNSLKKKSALTITDAIETGEERGSISVDFHTATTEKETKCEDEKSGTSIYNVENVGKNTYEATGFIDLQELQFISDDPTYDRLSLGGVEDGSQEEKLFLDSLSRNMVNMATPSFDYYYQKGCFVQDEWGERGVLLNTESVDMIVKKTLRGILNTMILRRGAYLKNTSLVIEVIMEGGETEEIEITKENIENLSFEYSQRYFEADEDKIKANAAKFNAYKAVEKKKNKKNEAKNKAKNEDILC